MPFDAAAKVENPRPRPKRHTRWKPWVGHNAALLARQVRVASGFVEAIATTQGPKILSNLRDPQGGAK